MSNQQQFFFDTQGDERLIYQEQQSGSDHDDLIEEQVVYRPRSESPVFMSFAEASQAFGSKKGKKKKRKDRKQPEIGLHVDSEQDFDETHLEDYAANLDPEFLESLRATSALASLEISGDETDDLIEEEYPNPFDILESSGSESLDSADYDDSDIQDDSFDEEIDDYGIGDDDFTVERKMPGSRGSSGQGSSRPGTSKSQARKTKKQLKKEERKRQRQERKERFSQGKTITERLKSSKKDKIPKQVLSILTKLNESIYKFVSSGKGNEHFLPPLDKEVRKLTHYIARGYQLRPKTRGSGKQKITILYRTQASSVPNNWKQIPERIVKQFGDEMPQEKKPKHSVSAATPQRGEIVGSSATPIGEDNIGHKMLLKLGWKPGQALGSNASQGPIEPVEVVVRGKRAGLGMD